ncbi:hypothetical protein Tco_1261139 [Tanacetum coccineum]
MASLDYRLNILFMIKECSSCGSLYNKGYCCTPNSSQQPLRDCPKCGNPVEGPNCQGCALWRKKLKEVWFTICHENGIYQDLLNTYESSDDDTNVVNAPREPFVVKQDPGENSSQNELINYSVENLVPIPSEFEGISKDTCDVPVCEDPSTFDALSDHSEILSDSNDDGTSSDDDDFEDIKYVSLEEVNNVDQERNEFDLDDILQSKTLPPQSLSPSRIVIRSLRSPITSFSYSDNSLPEFETFSDHTEETRSGSTTTHANNSLPEYDSFLFEIEPDQGGLISVVISDNSNDPLLELPEFESFHFDPSFPHTPPEPPDVEISLIIETDAPVINNFDELNEDECFDPGGGEIDVEDDDSFTFVIWTFLSFLTYPANSPLLLSIGSEDTIFDPGIST